MRNHCSSARIFVCRIMSRICPLLVIIVASIETRKYRMYLNNCRLLCHLKIPFRTKKDKKCVVINQLERVASNSIRILSEKFVTRNIIMHHIYSEAIVNFTKKRFLNNPRRNGPSARPTAVASHTHCHTQTKS